MFMSTIFKNKHHVVFILYKIFFHRELLILTRLLETQINLIN